MEEEEEVRACGSLIVIAKFLLWDDRLFTLTQLELCERRSPGSVTTDMFL